MQNTCDADDYCTDHEGPDHVYQVAIPEDGIWTFSLCGSAYDTYMYVGTTPCGQEVGYNDDYCSVQSQLSADITAGIYYVDVEGYSGACGDYVLNIWKLEECDPNCPAGATPEGEPDCYDEYDDVTNGGCNSTPYVFSPITCDETVCGTGGTFVFAGGNYRDTDWYEIELPAATTLTWTVCAEFASLIHILDANAGDCDNIVSLASANGEPNVEAFCSASVDAGTYWLFVATSEFSGVPCGSQYVATLNTNPNVCICGDFDDDGDCDIDDYWLFLDAFGTCVGHIKYLPEADFDGDECITLVDYQYWVQCYRDANPGKRFVPQLQRMGGKAAGQRGNAGGRTKAPPRP
jgi:hypothetical protein